MIAYNSKKRKFPKGIVIGACALCLFLIFNIFSPKVRNFFYTASYPVQKVLWQAGEASHNFLSPFFVVHKIKAENASLVSQNNLLILQSAVIGELGAENQVLRQALELNLQKEYNLQLVEVIARGDNGDSFLINRGLSDGIKVGMPLINAEKVLFGKISETYNNFSRVTLLSQKGFVFDVKLSGKDAYAVVRGDGGFGLSLDLIPRDANLVLDDIVLTSSMEGNFPKDLLVGRVSRIKTEDTKSFQTAELVPYFDVNATDNLFVITNFRN